MFRVRRATIAILGCALLSASPLSAADAPNPKTSGVKSPTPQAAAPLALPSAEVIITLIRRTLLTLNDALQTGNFTVLRDAAAPSFREKNTVYRLSTAFAALMAQNIDLSPVAVLSPQLVDPPSIDPRISLLRLRGKYDVKELRLEFELFFQNVGGVWRPFGISVLPQQ
jgi:hypothetical protein